MAKKKAAKRKSSKAANGEPAKRLSRGELDCARLGEFCRGLPATTMDVKWGADVVWSVGDKMFVAFCEMEDGSPGMPFGFKCSDEEFDRLTELPGIIPAPYAARFGWVSVREKSAITQKEAERLIAESYRLVVERLPRKVREGLNK